MGPVGRLGIGLILSTLVIDIYLRLRLKAAYLLASPWQLADPNLMILLILGVLFLLAEFILLVFYRRQAANLGKFPLTSVGPPRLEQGHVERPGSGVPANQVRGSEIPPPRPAWPELKLNGPWTELGYFRGEKGVYSLDLEVVGDASCLAGGNSTFWVSTGPDQSWVLGISLGTLSHLMPWIGFALLMVAVFWVLHTRTHRPEELSIRADRSTRLHGIAITLHSTRRPLNRRAVPLPPLSSLRAFSYIGVIVLAVPWMVFIILKPLPPMGLMVYLPKLGTLSALKEPRNEPLVLRIDASRHFYLNQQPVPFGDLPKRLRAALSLRSDWTVFLDADPEVVAGDVIQTTGVIQQATGAKVVLVTPSMKKEDPRLYGGQPCKVVPLDTNYLKPWPTISRFNVSKYAPPLVSYEINERGEVQNVELERRSGIAAIDDWVVHSVQKWRFKPTHCGTIITQTSLVIHFQ